MNIRGKFASLIAVVVLLAACGGGMSGTYVDSNGETAATFSSGKARIDFGLAGVHEMKYTVDGDRIVLHSVEGDLVLTRHSNGTLDTPWGTWKKQ